MVTLFPLTEEHLDALIEGFDNDVERYVRYMQDVVRGERHVLLAADNETNTIIGYVTVVWNSEYQGFARNNTPEIVDFIVAPEYRGKNIGNQLLDTLESVVQTNGYKTIGLGVGLGHDYGAAQRLYVKRGYIPDGTGIWHDSKQVQDGNTVMLSSHCVLMLVKEL